MLAEAGLMTLAEAGTVIGVSYSQVLSYVQRGLLSAKKFAKVWAVSIEDVDSFKPPQSPAETLADAGMMTPAEVAAVIGVSPDQVYSYLRSGALPGTKFANRWGVPAEDVRSFERPPSLRFGDPGLKSSLADAGLMTAAEAGAVLGVTRQSIPQYVQLGLLPGTKLANGLWVVPAGYVYGFKRPRSGGRRLLPQRAWDRILEGQVDPDDPHRYAHRGAVSRWSGEPDAVVALRRRDVVVGGTDAAVVRGALLTPRPDAAHVYVAEESMNGGRSDSDLMRGLVTDPLGEVVVRAVATDSWQRLHRCARTEDGVLHAPRRGSGPRHAALTSSRRAAGGRGVSRGLRCNEEARHGGSAGSPIAPACRTSTSSATVGWLPSTGALATQGRRRVSVAVSCTKAACESTSQRRRQPWAPPNGRSAGSFVRWQQQTRRRGSRHTGSQGVEPTSRRHNPPPRTIATWTARSRGCLPGPLRTNRCPSARLGWRTVDEDPASVLASAQRRRPHDPYCAAMTAPPSGCARDDCCQRQVPSDEIKFKATVARVVVEMLEQQIAPVRPGRTLGVKLDAAANRAAALQEAVLDATMDCRPPGAVSVASPSYTFRVISHPDAVRDRDGVERCRIVREPDRAVVIDFVMCGGLCVVTNRLGSWIVHSPPVRVGVET